MKLSILFVFVLFHGICLSQETKTSLKIYTCRMGRLHIVESNKLYFPNSYLNPDNPKEYDLVVDIDPTDMDSINVEVKNFLKVSGDEVLDNKCLVDGSHYKIVIEVNGKEIKRIYISNYFDSRFNQIALILNKYLAIQETEFSVTIDDASRDQKSINELIHEQNTCDMTTSEERKTESPE